MGRVCHADRRVAVGCSPSFDPCVAYEDYLEGEDLHALDLFNLAVRNTIEEGAARLDGQTHRHAHGMEKSMLYPKTGAGKVSDNSGAQRCIPGALGRRGLARDRRFRGDGKFSFFGARGESP
jgi:hypothetical protein